MWIGLVLVFFMVCIVEVMFLSLFLVVSMMMWLLDLIRFCVEVVSSFVYGVVLVGLVKILEFLVSLGIVVRILLLFICR